MGVHEVIAAVGDGTQGGLGEAPVDRDGPGQRAVTRRGRRGVRLGAHHTDPVEEFPLRRTGRVAGHHGHIVTGPRQRAGKRRDIATHGTG